MKNSDGFQLIELLITLSIISLLVGVSIPLYSHHLVQAKRLEAVTMLSKLAIAIEQYQLTHSMDQTVTLAALHFPTLIAKGSYELKLVWREQNYLLLAIPRGAQAEKDTACATLTLNAQGEKGIRGTGTLDECW